MQNFQTFHIMETAALIPTNSCTITEDHQVHYDGGPSAGLAEV